MNKEKISIQLGEFIVLFDELNGFTNQNTGEKIEGILDHELNALSRMWFILLNDIARPEKERLDQIKNDLITKYGTIDGDQVFVNQLNEDGTPNEKFTLFVNEYNSVLTEYKEIEYYPIKMEYLALITTKTLRSIYKFVQY